MLPFNSGPAGVGVPWQRRDLRHMRQERCPAPPLRGVGGQRESARVDVARRDDGVAICGRVSASCTAFSSVKWAGRWKSWTRCLCISTGDCGGKDRPARGSAASEGRARPRRGAERGGAGGRECIQHGFGRWARGERCSQKRGRQFWLKPLWLKPLSQDRRGHPQRLEGVVELTRACCGSLPAAPSDRRIGRTPLVVGRRVSRALSSAPTSLPCAAASAWRYRASTRLPHRGPIRPTMVGLSLRLNSSPWRLAARPL